ncbi:MAG: respiratory nitrate reductase subunit gamma [Candidatus Hydrogenedentes bacterium]|nr:respiratory nitrate reductase subunit gamma [Candidatus Hydrogenedentota bacterium]
MLEQFLFIGLPYIAFAIMVVVSIYRYRVQRFTYTALGSQFLEGNQLRWGSLAWHAGILVILIGHLIPVIAPGLWKALASVPAFLITVELMGIIAAFLSLTGLVVLFCRRVASARVSAVTSTADLLLLLLLIAQVLVGISVASGARWGAAWSASTTTPYLWSLATLHPQTEYITGLPPTVRLHLVLAWCIFLIVPFTRLVHVFSVPVAYLWRPPQKVVWTTRLPQPMGAHTMQLAQDTRRYFLRGALGTAGAAFLLSVGALDRLGRFFRGPAMDQAHQAELLQKKLQRLELAAAERALEIERIEKQYIFVAQLSELSDKDGKYFTDYHMRPALAFKDASGLPLLISAKCTHLGCTVASTMVGGRILCPCHVSWFDVKTGKPAPGAPAKVPLPHIGWVLMDAQGNLVASQGATGERAGEIDMAQAGNLGVYIAKQFEETA